MTNRERLHNAVGLAMKAGRCVSGDFAVERTVRSGKALLALLDPGASENTKDRYDGLCRKYRIPLLFVEELGRTIGKPSRMVAAVTDTSFKNMILCANEPQETAGNTTAGVETAWQK